MAETLNKEAPIAVPENSLEYDLEKINPKLAALAWENFLKMRASHFSSSRAKLILESELTRFQAMGMGEPKNPNLPLLDGNWQESLSELKSYFVIGEQAVRESRFAYGLLHELRDSQEDEGTDEEMEAMLLAESHYDELRVKTWAQLIRLSLEHRGYYQGLYRKIENGLDEELVNLNVLKYIQKKNIYDKYAEQQRLLEEEISILPEDLFIADKQLK